MTRVAAIAVFCFCVSAPAFADEPDGALYVADSKKGRIWRIYYGDEAP
ncbi:MAG TPA: hypothetical protein VJM78_07240 [Rhizomicrobium sp.]|nr:hypothetical protein [Rhizomicrobium sp.]